MNSTHIHEIGCETRDAVLAVLRSSKGTYEEAAQAAYDKVVVKIAEYELKKKE